VRNCGHLDATRQLAKEDDVRESLSDCPSETAVSIPDWESSRRKSLASFRTQSPERLRPNLFPRDRLCSASVQLSYPAVKFRRPGGCPFGILGAFHALKDLRGEREPVASQQLQRSLQKFRLARLCYRASLAPWPSPNKSLRRLPQGHRAKSRRWARQPGTAWFPEAIGRRRANLSLWRSLTRDILGLGFVHDRHRCIHG
jgi:hypothetical protein